MESGKNNLVFGGHLEEFDNLEKWGRDAPLNMDREDNQEALVKMIDGTAKQMVENGRNAVLFISSSKIRSKETSQLIADGLKNKLGNDIKIRYFEDENLDSNCQGEFILPDNYSAGEVFQGLKIAGKIYGKESFQEKNLHYRFGDPFMQEDGSYKYPELLDFFSKSGESYSEPLVRMITSVLDLSKKVHKLEKNVEVVIVAHGLTYHILRGLGVIGCQILKDGLVIEPGELAYKIWEVYFSRESELRETVYGMLDITNLGNSELLKMLEDEIISLQK